VYHTKEIESSVHMGTEKTVSSRRAVSYGTNGVIHTNISYSYSTCWRDVWKMNTDFFKQISGSACETVFSTKILREMSRGISN